MSKCYTVWPKCKAHLHIYNTSHETGTPEKATRDIKNIATCGEVQSTEEGLAGCKYQVALTPLNILL